MKRYGSGLLLVLAMLANSRSCDAVEWIRIDGNTSCRRLTPTMVMRDAASCGRSTIFCSTPIQCFGPSGRGTVGTAICRASRFQRPTLDPAPIAKTSAAIVTGPATCPNLQSCADDPNPELGTEADLPRWSGFSDSDLSFFAAGGPGTSISHK